ncbi:MAG: serine/threonine-protein kinase [Gemmataceae bacterium]
MAETERGATGTRTRREHIIEDFEAAWAKGTPPDLDAYIPKGDVDRRLLVELIHADLEFRLKRGDKVRIEDYIRRYAELKGDPEALASLIAAEFRLRQRSGSKPALDDYLRRFPELAGALRKLLKTEPADVAQAGIPTIALPAAEQTAAFSPQPSAVSVDEVAETIERGGLLLASQLDKLQRDLKNRYSDATALVRLLVEWGWLTNFQGEQLLRGRGADLLVGQYVLLSPLGQGGMGQVFKARHGLMKRVIALKAMRQEYSAAPDAMRRFRREIEAASQLSHPNIVTAHDAFQSGTALYFAMEYVEGNDLSRLVAERREPLPIATACEYIRQAALGLQHAHERGMVHRDIKPSNLLLTADGSLVKILDMGLARLVYDLGDGGRRLTQVGAVFGTPDYIAPEQAVDARDVDIRADVYSLGCTLYYLLTGSAPFPGGGIVEKLQRQRAAEPLAVEKARPDVGPILPGMLRKMMAKRPEDRYQTPGEVAQALAPLCGGVATPVVAALPPPASRSPIREAPNDKRVGTFPESQSHRGEPSLVLLPPAAGSGQRPRVPSSRKRAGIWVGAALFLLGAGVFLVLRFSGGAGEGRAPESPPPVVEKEKKELTLPGVGLLEFGPSVVSKFDSRYLDALDHAKIPALEKFEWQHKDLVAVLGEHRLRGTHTAVSLDGSLIATASPGYVQGVSLGDPERLRQDRYLPVPSLVSLAISADKQTLAVGQGDGSVSLWSIKEGKEIAKLKPGAKGALLRPQFSNGTRLIGCVGTQACVWDTKTAEPFGVLKGHEGNLTCCAISQDGKLALTGCVAGVLRLWNIDDARTIASIDPPKDAHAMPHPAVHSVAFSNDGTQIAAGLDEEIHVWKTVEFGSEKKACVFKFGAYQSLAFSPDGKLLLADSNSYLQLLDLEAGKFVWGYGLDHPGQIAFYRSGSKRLLVSAGTDVRALDEETKTEPMPLRGPAGHVQAVAVSPDGRYVGAGAGGFFVRMAAFWDLATGKEHLCNAGNEIVHVGFGPDSRLFFFSGHGGASPSLVDTGSGVPPALKLQTEGVVNATEAAISPNGRFLLGGFRDGPVELWDLRTGAIVRSFKRGGYSSVDFAPSGRLALIGGELWDLEASRKVGSVKTPCHFLPDGRILELGGDPAFYNADTSSIRELSKAPLPSVTWIAGARPSALSSNGKRLAAILGAQVNVFEVETGALVWSYAPEPSHFVIRAVALSADGRYLFTGNSNGTVYIYRLP